MVASESDPVRTSIWLSTSALYRSPSSSSFALAAPQPNSRSRSVGVISDSRLVEHLVEPRGVEGLETHRPVVEQRQPQARRAGNRQLPHRHGIVDELDK